MPILCWSFFDKVCFRTWTRNEWSCASWWPSLRLISKANSAILILPEQGVEWMSKSPTSNPLMSNHSDWRRQKVFNDSWSPFWYHITIYIYVSTHAQFQTGRTLVKKHLKFSNCVNCKIYNTKFEAFQTIRFGATPFPRWSWPNNLTC